MIRRFAAGTAVAAGLTLTLTGCLGDAKEGASEAGKNIRLSAAQILGQSAEKAGKADSYKADVIVDSQLTQGAMKMEMSVATRTKPDVAMQMNVKSMSMGGQTVPGYEARIVGDYMYLKMPALASRNGGKPWARISLTSAGQAAGGMNLKQMLDQSKQQNPAEQTKMLTASKDVREVGTENVGGVQTRHYTGTVSPQEALAKLDPQNRAAMEKTYAQLGNAPIAFDLWVGDDSLPRKMVNKLQTQMGAVNTTMVFSDYGKPVDVAAPPAAETGTPNIPGLTG
ncbi:LppX_LprAFG lipoprotein [Actinomadura hibisca]|uniref:LppX_LprAFG lipoprotein n=1 Tax=Actinomadura hibisca TaxID=68565 RepID=UPI000835657C|nr:LppX_LprAFG lipoprotein [Actinomadura hibisca]